MPTKPTLTKSLHTITAVANVARYIATAAPRKMTAADAAALTAHALEVLGYDMADFAKSDVTVARCVAAVAKVLS